MIKKVAVLLFLGFSTTVVFGQTVQDLIKVELIDRSDEIIDNPIHFHLFKVTNDSDFTQELILTTNATSCANIDLSKQSSLITQTYSVNLSDKLSEVTLNPKESKEFYVKTSRPKDVELSTWSCFEVKAVTLLNDFQSNSVIMKNLIPNPKNAN